VGLRKYTTKIRAGFQDPTKKQLYMRKRREREREREKRSEKMRSSCVLQLSWELRLTHFVKVFKSLSAREKRKKRPREEERWWVCDLGFRV
jgi:hypothetical protein